MQDNFRRMHVSSKDKFSSRSISFISTVQNNVRSDEQDDFAEYIALSGMIFQNAVMDDSNIETEWINWTLCMYMPVNFTTFQTSPFPYITQHHDLGQASYKHACNLRYFTSHNEYRACRENEHLNRHQTGLPRSTG